MAFNQSHSKNVNISHRKNINLYSTENCRILIRLCRNIACDLWMVSIGHASLTNISCFRYCANLPSDAFTHLTPSCTIKELKEGEATQYTAAIRLPINSPYKTLLQVGLPLCVLFFLITEYFTNKCLS